jgi:hypothetical protein
MSGVHIGTEPGATVRMPSTAAEVGVGAVHFLMDLFKFKFNYLNMNLIV